MAIETQDEWNIEDLYYINMGRWADDLVGPFPERMLADLYIDQMDWRGQRPRVVGVREPDKGLMLKLLGSP